MTTTTQPPVGTQATRRGTDRELAERVKRAGLRPTRQRVSLARLLFNGDDKHVTAEQLHKEAKDADLPVSLATVYNTLNQFTEVGLLREVVVEPGRSYFDTNIHDHHHFYYQDDGSLQDIPGEQVRLAELPQAPDGTRVDRVDVIVRVRRNG
nr:Fur family transcriptional regulator [Rhodovibrio salinarum]